MGSGGKGVTLGPQLASNDEAVVLRAVCPAGTYALGCDYDGHVDRLMRRQDDLRRKEAVSFIAFRDSTSHMLVKGAILIV